MRESVLQTGELELADENTRFECLRCRGCCIYEVTLTPREEKMLSSEVERIGRRLGRLSVNGRDLATTLAAGRGGSRCLFVRGNECTVYGKRPTLCRLYPFFPIEAEAILTLGHEASQKTITIRSDAGRTYFLAYDPSCKGIGVGGRLDIHEIESLCKMYLDDNACAPWL